MQVALDGLPLAVQRRRRLGRGAQLLQRRGRQPVGRLVQHGAAVAEGALQLAALHLEVLHGLFGFWRGFWGLGGLGGLEGGFRWGTRENGGRGRCVRSALSSLVFPPQITPSQLPPPPQTTTTLAHAHLRLDALPVHAVLAVQELYDVARRVAYGAVVPARAEGSGLGGSGGGSGD